MWTVSLTKAAAKESLKLPTHIRELFQLLLTDMAAEGPRPLGWASKTLKSRDEVSIRLTREYRVLVTVVKPNLIVVKVAHRKEVYD